MIKTTA